MSTATKVSPSTVRQALDADESLLLVCAYSDDAKCEQTGVEPSISLSELNARVSTLPKDQRLVFFCG